ncbi:PREDICTED: probable cytochrome P450 12c1, mitochondrial [Rhagoletis zephyria]|uniref:probable cytochrome P450 12c1, mitochondrial n=1 Tax=Rhagoletis zephyria TaxID=28612 RepID=UPI0008116305|nr:PREDICTED: probable cytochrome P450 12c1, mitochondrial [Rhagoletis zephyria]XP_017485041.1 PREDICTED: probable cytochrome P450 12c1, mitochondrial [Rhagoletis zephyria]
MSAICKARNAGTAVVRVCKYGGKQQQQLQKSQIALQSTLSNAKIESVETKSSQNTFNFEWQQALSYKAIPRLTRYQMFRGFVKGGEFVNLSLNDFLFKCREKFGDIYRMAGVIGQPDTVVLFSVDDFGKIFRTEGKWPSRPGTDAIRYYRESRKDGFFIETGGLNAEGEKWGAFRNQVNPILMHPKNAKLYLEPLQNVNLEFVKRIRDIRDPHIHEVPDNFFEDINHLAFDSIGVVALDYDFGLTRKNPDSKDAKLLCKHMSAFLKSIYDLGIKPSFYKYIKTPTYRRFEESMDLMFDITNRYVNEAVARLEEYPSTEGEERSVLEKLLKITRQTAIVMAMDMLMGGVDAPSSAIATIVLCIAKNPEKQQKLREELFAILPHKNDRFSIDNMKQLPYLRACIKEALRLYPLAFGTARITGADLVLSGYQVPKGTPTLIATNSLPNEERFFPRPREFIPERWLRQKDASSMNVDEQLIADNVNKFINLPFGFGPRSCVGKRIADLEMELTLANVVRNFHIEYNYPAENAFKYHFISTPAIPLKFKFVDLK